MRATRTASLHEQRTGKGDCYKWSAETVLLLMPRGTVCHGTVTGQGPVEGVRFGHAWVEQDGLAFDPSGYVGTIERYYALGEIVPAEVKRYTRAQIAHHIRRTGHTGPHWDAPVGKPGAAGTIRPKAKRRRR